MPEEENVQPLFEGYFGVQTEFEILLAPPALHPGSRGQVGTWAVALLERGGSYWTLACLGAVLLVPMAVGRFAPHGCSGHGRSLQGAAAGAGVLA